MKRTRIAAMSAKRRAELAAAGNLFPTSTLVARKPSRASRGRDTGPSRTTRELVRERSGGMCEWPMCTEQATEVHHRLGRKAGGRHGEAHVRINGAAWLLDACRTHHDYVTSAFGERYRVARDRGWLLLEHEDAQRVAVWTRHLGWPVWLLNDGSWLRYEEASA